MLGWVRLGRIRLTPIDRYSPFFPRIYKQTTAISRTFSRWLDVDLVRTHSPSLSFSDNKIPGFLPITLGGLPDPPPVIFLQGTLAVQRELMERAAALQVAALKEEIAELKEGSEAQNGGVSLVGEVLECDVITRTCTSPVEVHI